MGVKGLSKFLNGRWRRQWITWRGRGIPCYSGKILMSEYETPSKMGHQK